VKARVSAALCNLVIEFSPLRMQVVQHKSTNTDAAAGTKKLASTKVQILTQMLVQKYKY
jgi:hypothetical protein